MKKIIKIMAIFAIVSTLSGCIIDGRHGGGWHHGGGHRWHHSR